jgi:hypothetical protein
MFHKREFLNQLNNYQVFKKDPHALKFDKIQTVFIEIHTELQHTKLHGSIILNFVLCRLVTTPEIIDNK